VNDKMDSNLLNDLKYEMLSVWSNAHKEMARVYEERHNSYACRYEIMLEKSRMAEKVLQKFFLQHCINEKNFDLKYEDWLDTEIQEFQDKAEKPKERG
jgi:hypothetical protein